MKFKTLGLMAILVTMLSGASLFASTVTVKISTPLNGSVVGSPMHISASANSSRRITGWIIYLDSVNAYQTGATKTITADIPITSGTHSITVRAWNSAGVAGASSLSVTGPSAAPAVSVAVSPSSAVVQSAGAQQFSATVSGTTNTAVTWLVNGVVGGTASVGTITSSGLYTAPTVTANTTATVKAQSNADPTKSASASISVTAPPAPPAITVSVSPSTATVQSAGTQQFAATVSGTTNTAVTWLVNGVVGGTASVGTITSSGLYTAPAVTANTTATVKAQSNADSTKSASANITVTAPAPAITVSVSPSTATVQSAGTQQFAATVTNSTNTGVTWSVQGVGTVSTSGLYTAPSVTSSTTAKVIATSNADTTKQAIASLTISAPTSGSTVNVQSYGAAGNGIADDTTPIANSIAALRSGDTLYFPCGTYRTTSQLTLRLSNVSVAGPAQSPNCVTIKSSGGSSVLAITSSSGLGSTTALTANSADQSSSLSANFSGIGVVAGDYVVLSEGGKGFSTDVAPGNETGCDISGCRGEVAKIASVSGSVATLVRPLNHPYSSGNAPTVRRMASPVSGVQVSNINFDCSSVVSGGLSLSYAVNNSVTDVGALNCVDSGIRASYGYGNSFTRTAIVNSGSPNAGAMDIRNQNQMTMNTSNISVNGGGHNFGLGLYIVNDSTVSNISVNGNNSTGRTFKLLASARNSITNLATTGVGGGTSGFTLQYYAHHNTITDCKVTGNTGHGVTTFGNFNTYNKFINCTVTGNTGNAFSQSPGTLGTADDHYTTIQGGTWSGISGYAVLQMNSSYLTMTGATVKGPGSCGLCLGGLSGEVVNGASISNNTFSGLPGGSDVYMTTGGGSGNHFSGNSTPDGSYPNPLP